VEALGVYLLSFGILSLSALSFSSYYNTMGIVHFRTEIFQLSSLLVGLILFFFAYGKILKFGIESFLARMGSCDPQPVVRVEGGGWGEDKSVIYYNHVLLGEMNIANANDRAAGKFIANYTSLKIGKGKPDSMQDIENTFKK